MRKGAVLSLQGPVHQELGGAGRLLIPTPSCGGLSLFLYEIIFCSLTTVKLLFDFVSFHFVSCYVPFIFFLHILLVGCLDLF